MSRPLTLRCGTTSASSDSDISANSSPPSPPSSPSAPPSPSFGNGATASPCDLLENVPRVRETARAPLPIIFISRGCRATYPSGFQPKARHRVSRWAALVPTARCLGLRLPSPLVHQPAPIKADEATHTVGILSPHHQGGWGSFTLVVDNLVRLDLSLRITSPGVASLVLKIVLAVRTQRENLSFTHRRSPG